MPFRRRIAQIAALLVLIHPFVPAGAAVRSLVVPVGGMTCPLCTRGVEESIRRLDGVASVTADLATGQVRVEAAEGASLSLKDVRERVVRAGFRVDGEASLVANGRFVVGPDGKITFRVRGTPYVYRVLEGGGLQRFLRAYPHAEGEFLVGFRLHDHARWKPAAMSILTCEPVPAAPRQAAR